MIMSTCGRRRHYDDSWVDEDDDDNVIHSCINSRDFRAMTIAATSPKMQTMTTNKEVITTTKTMACHSVVARNHEAIRCACKPGNPSLAEEAGNTYKAELLYIGQHFERDYNFIRKQIILVK